MRTHAFLARLSPVLVVTALSSAAAAAPTLRVQVDQKGDFVLFGNTLGHECGGGTPAPVVGAVGNCGGSLGDSAPDVFWRSDSPGVGQAEANTGISVAQARSTSVLNLPAGATVTHAFLYWGAALNAPGVDTTVTLERQGGFSQSVTALASFQTGNAYQSVADVTAIVQANGPGAYRLGGVDSANLVNANNNTNFAGWWVAVFYQLATEPPRNLALFDGLDPVSGGNPQNVVLSGFLVPAAGFDGKLGVVTFEGDNSINGDSLFFNGGAPLSNAVNAADNFFNGSRSLLGAPVTIAGDLPQLTGGPQSMSGIDLDVVDIASKLTAGQTSAPIQATSTGDVYYLAGFITSISTFKPDFSTSGKSVVDVNGGALLPGDVLQYTIDAVNTGNDTAVGAVVTDALPAGVTYVPGSLAITAGPNAGAKSDVAGDDQGEFVSATDTLVIRIGSGANAVQGGTLAPGEGSTITFQVTVDAAASGTIENQAIVNASGLLGAPPADTPTDGNGGQPGSPPTPVVIDLCADNAGCVAPTPFCDTSSDPNVCVQCLVDADCAGTTPTCDPATHTCICVPTGAEVCNGNDDDCNGTVDDGNPGGGQACATGLPGLCADGTTACQAGNLDCVPTVAPDTVAETCDSVDQDCDGTVDDGLGLGNACMVGVGACQATGTNICDGQGGVTCDATPGQPTQEQCGDAIDSDCDGQPSNGCADDADGDGLSDADEGTLGTDPNDADSDDDGVPDGAEIDPGTDSDGDGLINALDPDSDNDGLFDGTELGLGCDGPATDTTKGHCVPDADKGATTTNPTDADTDDGGVTDGAEDSNLDGAIDAGETDPNDPSDDDSVVDTDGDGLSDGLEATIGTDPNDADSDDDGVIDGKEANPADDTDGDGLINALDPDSDDDGLFDGTEMGFGCDDPATDATKGTCIPDGDGGQTKTSPVDPDTDDGGVSDGDEDTNKNGVVDTGETDPNDPADDVVTGCTDDADCGAADSGKVCDPGTKTCIQGCRGQDGNGCPSGQTCSSNDATIGTCSAGAGGGAQSADDVYLEGNGLCAQRPGSTGGAATLAFLGALGALLATRRRGARPQARRPPTRARRRA